jgi:hypothetical protein
MNNFYENKVMTTDGKWIDKADACTFLRPHPKSEKLFFDRSGSTYVKDENGTLRKWPPKEKGKKKNKKRQAENKDGN